MRTLASISFALLSCVAVSATSSYVTSTAKTCTTDYGKYPVRSLGTCTARTTYQTYISTTTKTITPVVTVTPTRSVTVTTTVMSSSTTVTTLPASTTTVTTTNVVTQTLTQPNTVLFTTTLTVGTSTQTDITVVVTATETFTSTTTATSLVLPRRQIAYRRGAASYPTTVTCSEYVVYHTTVTCTRTLMPSSTTLAAQTSTVTSTVFVKSTSTKTSNPSTTTATVKQTTVQILSSTSTSIITVSTTITSLTISSTSTVTSTTTAITTTTIIPSPSAQPNALVNGGFESGSLAPGFAANGYKGVAEVAAGDSQEGTYHAVLTCPTPTGFDRPFNIAISQTFTTVPNTVQSISFYYKITTRSDLSPALLAISNGNNYIDSIAIDHVSTDYELYTTTFVAQDLTSTLELQLQCGAGMDVISIDNVVVAVNTL